MSTVKIVSGKGYSKQEAFAEKASYKVNADATVAWKKAGSPVGDEFKEFAKAYLERKVKSAPGIGYSVSVTPGVQDDRERPYSSEVVAQVGKRKYKGVYACISKENQILGKRDKKSQAISLAKQLTTDLHIDIDVIPMHIVAEGEKVAAYITYTPSIKTKEGSYLFFGVETD